MIVVRNTFQVKFGQMRDAMQLWQEGKQFVTQDGSQNPRLMTDLTGDFYTLVMEHEFPTLAEYEKAMQGTMQTSDWRNWYQKLTPLVEHGKREIFKVVE